MRSLVAGLGVTGLGLLVAADPCLDPHPEELALHEAHETALVAVHFHTVHGVTLTEADWERSFGGEVPREILRDRALTSARRDRAIQLLAAAHRLGQPLPFPGFAAHVDAVNQARRAAVQAGQRVYGRVEVTPWILYRYEVDNLRLRLQAQFRLRHSDDESAAREVEEAIEEAMLGVPARLELSSGQN